MKRRSLSFVLALLLIIGMMPVYTNAMGSNPFKDVAESDYYYNSVIWAYYHDPQITNGMSSTEFGPLDTVTTGQAVTFLWRSRGCPEPVSQSSGFLDVEAGSWYEKAVIWAVENQITNGTGDGKFSPAMTLQRNHLITFLWRTMGEPGKTDAVIWYEDAENWANQGGLLDGTGKAYQSNDPCPRCDVVLYLYRVLEEISQEEDTIIEPESGEALPFSKELTEEDVSELTSDTFDLTAGVETTIHFDAMSTLIVPSFSLLLNGSDTGVVLVDDDLDGIYTGTYTVNPTSETTLKFSAQTSVGGKKAVTNDFEIPVTEPISDATNESMELVTGTVSDIMRTVNEELSGIQLSEEQKAEWRMDAVISYLRQLTGYSNGPFVIPVGNGTIYERDPGNPSVLISNLYVGSERTGDPYTIYYTIDGIELAVECMDAEANEEDGSDSFSVPLSEDENPSGELMDSTAYMTDRETAVVLCYYSKSETDQGQVGSAIQCSDTLEKAGYLVTERFNCTVDNFKNLKDFSVVVVRSHGSVKNSVPCICTQQVVTKSNKKTYSSDIKKNRIIVVTEGDGSSYYYIRPDLFKHYYKGKNYLNSNLFYLSICSGCYNDKLAKALTGCGADAVVGMSDVVKTTYNSLVLQDILTSLLNGKKLDQAIKEAKDNHGANDAVWYKNTYNENDTTPAEPISYGSNIKGLHSQLQNSNFEQGVRYGNWFFWRLTQSYWSWWGAATTKSRELNTTPFEGKAMASISTGKNALHNETFSTFFQPILIPEDATYLSFDYKVMTEEFSRSQENRQNDYFQVAFLNPSTGVIQKTIHRIPVLNYRDRFQKTQSVYHAGIPCYSTGWYKRTVNISDYRGRIVTFCFWIEDQGDNQYDTTAVVDKIQIW